MFFLVQFETFARFSSYELAKSNNNANANSFDILNNSNSNVGTAGVAVYGLFEIDVGTSPGDLNKWKVERQYHIKGLHTSVGVVSLLIVEEAAPSNISFTQ